MVDAPKGLATAGYCVYPKDWRDNGRQECYHLQGVRTMEGTGWHMELKGRESHCWVCSMKQSKIGTIPWLIPNTDFSPVARHCRSPVEPTWDPGDMGGREENGFESKSHLTAQFLYKNNVI